MTCHSCTHSDAIQRGDYDSMPWKELPCATCKLAEDTFHSIPFDESRPPSCAVGIPSALVKPSGSVWLPADVLSDFVNRLLSLPLELRDVVSLRFQGLPYKEIALRQGTTIQCAEMRHKRAMKIWPELEALFPYKTAKRKRRRAKR
jgi:DNA-directed RNA polymerase specialized sigma24 family protein